MRSDDERIQPALERGMREQESSTHCETFLPSMSGDFNTCSWSAYRRGGDGANLHYHNGSIRDSYAAAADSSYSGGYERDFHETDNA